MSDDEDFFKEVLSQAFPDEYASLRDDGEQAADEDNSDDAGGDSIRGFSLDLSAFVDSSNVPGFLNVPPSAFLGPAVDGGAGSVAVQPSHREVP